MPNFFFQVRSNAVVTLHRAIMLGEPLSLSAELWGSVVKFHLLDLVQALISRVSARDLPHSEKTLRSAVKTLSKTFLQYLDQLKTLATFPVIWLDLLSAFQVLGRFQHLLLNCDFYLVEFPALPEQIT